MNKPLALVAIAAAAPAALLGGLLGGCTHHSWNPTTHYHAFLVPIDPPAGETDVNLHTEFGDLDVAITGTELSGHARRHYTGELPDGPYVVAVTRSNYPDRPAAATVEPIWNGTELSLITNWPGGRNGRNGEGTSYTVRVHHLDAATLDSEFGDIDILGATGPVNAQTKFGDIALRAERATRADLETQQGDISVWGLAGPVDALSSFGDIELHAANVTDARLVSHQGDISVWDLAGPLYANTSFGDIEGERLGGTVEARSAQGDIDLVLTPRNAGPFTAVSSFGDVHVTAGPALAGLLEMDTDFGSTRFTGTTDDGRHFKVRSDDHASVNISEGPRSLAKTSQGDVRVVIAEER